jgi:hypothetical protein
LTDRPASSLRAAAVDEEVGMENRLLITVAVVALAALLAWVFPGGLRPSSPSSMAASDVAPPPPLR